MENRGGASTLVSGVIIKVAFRTVARSGDILDVPTLSTILAANTTEPWLLPALRKNCRVSVDFLATCPLGIINSNRIPFSLISVLSTLDLLPSHLRS